MDSNNLEDEVDKATSFMARNLLLSERGDEDGETEGTLYLAGKVLTKNPAGTNESLRFSREFAGVESLGT